MIFCVDLKKPLQVVLMGHSICRSGWWLGDRMLPEYELIVVYQGVLRCDVGGETYYLNEGDACVIPPNTPVDQSADAPCRFFYTHFTGDVTPAEEPLIHRVVSNSANQAERKTEDIFFLPPSQADDLLILLSSEMAAEEAKDEVFTRFQRILLERGRPSPHSNLLILLELSQILTLLSQTLMRSMIPAPDLSRRDQNKFVQDALDYLESHLSEPLSVRALAHRLHISEQYLTRLFKADTGLSPVKYHNRLRIEKVKEILRLGQHNIGEAAAAVGFDNIFYFSRLFKQLEGMSPSAYRAWLNAKSNQ